MPNPVTQSIARNIQDARVLQFISLWDAFEELVIAVFRSKQCSPEQAGRYRQVHQELVQLYPSWQSALAPYWRQSRVKGQQDLQDPYQRLLSHADAAEFIGDWAALKHLPPAREALNNYLLSIVPPQE